MDPVEHAERFRRLFLSLQEELQKVIVGHTQIIQEMLICLFVGGHGLLEGVPGLGKTLLVKSLSRCLDLEFSRIQFTPDLMPADIIGTNIVEDTPEGKSFRFQKGPLFGQIVLADEINRATPKTQSALLEAMQEVAATVGGERYPLKRPFFILATQNPIEIEGTYSLPEAQLDRFLFKLTVRYPSHEELKEIMSRTTTAEEPTLERITRAEEVERMKAFVREVPLASQVMDYAARLVFATHPDNAGAPESVRKFIRYGSSPRGAQALVLSGKANALLASRFNVSFDDIKAAALPALRHRLILNFGAEAEGISTDTIIADVLEKVPVESRLTP